MKIAIPANAPDFGASVENRLGTAPYLLVIDIEDMSFEAVAGPSPAAGPGAGIEAISVVTGMGAKAILAGFISPHISVALEKQGIVVITPVDGPVIAAVEKYKEDLRSRMTGTLRQPDVNSSSTIEPRLKAAFSKAARQFLNILPVLIGVILLVGLFRGFVSRDMLLTIFSGKEIQDTLWGACIGSVLSGNPVNSYVVGETMLTMGVSLFGAAALMMTWVNVGLLQLPAEISALGARFAITRTIAAFLMAIVVSVLIVILTGGQVR
jgi:predicted Fe-Mo cluster-binding NifX family protein